MFRVDEHGSSGRWNPGHSYKSVHDAIAACHKVKAAGFGTRIVREPDEFVVMNAPWQEPVESELTVRRKIKLRDQAFVDAYEQMENDRTGT